MAGRLHDDHVVRYDERAPDRGVSKLKSPLGLMARPLMFLKVSFSVVLYKFVQMPSSAPMHELDLGSRPPLIVPSRSAT